MSLLDAMARAAWDEREKTFESRLRVPFDNAVPVSSDITVLMVRAALAEARRHGWQLVPVEATNNMMISGAAAITAYVKDDETDSGDVYRAMLSSAPSIEEG